MAENTIKVRQKQRYDTEANWTSKNPVLLAGEIAISSDKNGLMKVGDGKSLWTTIPYSKASLSKTDVTTALGYTPPTTNTTYSIGTSSTAGIVKLYTGTGSNTDGSMTQAAIKSALDGKSGTGHSHNYAGSNSAGGVAINSYGLYNYSATRPTTANINLGDDKYRNRITYMLASSSMTEGKPPQDSQILSFGWDTSVGWGAQLAIKDPSDGISELYIRGSKSVNNVCTLKDVPWATVLDSNNYTTYAAAKAHTHDINALINTLGTGTATPTDNDYYICQTAGGGTSNLTYARRSTSSLWNYIKTKTDATYLPLTGGTVTGVTSFTNTTASTSTTTGAVKVSGGVGISGRMSANEVGIGSGAVIKYDSTNKCINFVFS